MTIFETIAAASSLDLAESTRPTIESPFFPASLPLEADERWRFAVDLGSCIGCHACEVACGVQNGLPAELQWRRVGDVETGSFPARRLNVSMACNHCVNPTCLQGCPANAYEVLSSGIVVHLDDECIGCTYCTWTCAYQAPVFRPDLNIVTKCDMCHSRLEEGRSTACAEACPTNAIRVERVRQADIVDSADLDLPFLPPSTITGSTTAWIVPDDWRDSIETGSFLVADEGRAEPEPSHWPLVVVTIGSQLTAGLALAACVAGSASSTRAFVVATGVVSALGSSGSLAHLGRPLHAWKAFRNVRRSWLSREAVAFAVHAMLSGGLAALVLLGVEAPNAALAVSALLAIVGVWVSSMVYRLPARPVWNSRLTTLQFVATASAFGALALLLDGQRAAVLLPALALGGISAVVGEARRHWLVRGSLGSGTGEHPAITRARRRSADVLASMRSEVRARRVLLVAGLAVVPFSAPFGALLVVTSEVVERRLFYRSSLPLDMPSRFTGWNRGHG